MSNTQTPGETVGLRAVDLFSGCGGISCGLSTAGFGVMAGADVERKYIQTFKLNFPGARAVMADLSKTDPAGLLASLGMKAGELDLLAGGPPCQGFSKNVPRRNRYLEQEQNTQVLTFLRYCEAWLPKFVLMENVAEMKARFERAYSGEVVERLCRLGYVVDHAVLNAADYGVPQRRRRAFFIAARGGLKPAIPKPTHANGGEKGLFPESGHVTVWDAIGDLPSIPHGGGRSPAEYACGAQNAFQAKARGDAKTVRNHVARSLQPTQYARLAALAPGEGMKQLPPELQTRGGYSGAYGRLTESMIAPTITR